MSESREINFLDYQTALCGTSDAKRDFPRLTNRAGAGSPALRPSSQNEKPRPALLLIATPAGRARGGRGMTAGPQINDRRARAFRPRPAGWENDHPDTPPTAPTARQAPEPD